ncbi:MAG: helix-turn-helix domain-containing protein, partial [Acidimicrobiia bacterium]
VADVFARDCPSRTIVDHVASKWGTLALVALAESPYRFNALRRRVDGISEKMLSQTLHTLERDGMVVRDVQSAIPPRVEYSLTDLGAQVAARLRDLIELVEGSVNEVIRARHDHDSSAA